MWWWIPMNISNDHNQCQNCENLEKLSYMEAHPTHHENWRCKAQGITMQYEFTVGWKICSRHKPKR